MTYFFRRRYNPPSERLMTELCSLLKKGLVILLMATNNRTGSGGNNKAGCSFCGRDEEHVNFLIPSPTGLLICDHCIDICNEIIEEHLRSHGSKGKKSDTGNDVLTFENLPKPFQIKKSLDEYVIGQDRAKKALSVAVYNHYKRVLTKEASVSKQKVRKKDGCDDYSTNDVEIQKSNVLLLGPTGVGKTYLAQTLAKTLRVPFAIADATTLTEAGYVGEDVENILLRLIQAADYDIERAEKGIIYIDEVDKVSRRSENRSITRDVSGEGVQQALLKILEGTVSNVPPQGGRKHPNQEFIQINTENILFICGGSFDGIQNLIEARRGGQTMGFSGSVKSKSEINKDNIYAEIIPHDIVKFGLIPELVGRLPILVGLDNLDRNALVRILTEPKNSLIKQYKRLFELDNTEIEFTEGALNKVADRAIERSTGARGLRAIMEEIMLDIMYDVPSRDDIEKVIVDENSVEHKEPPRLILRAS